SRAKACGIGADTHPRHQALRALQPARQSGVLFLKARDFRAPRHRSVHQFLMRPPCLAQFASLISSQDRFPQKIEQERVESLEPVLVAQIVSKQDVLLKEEYVVLA